MFLGSVDQFKITPGLDTKSRLGVQCNVQCHDVKSDRSLNNGGLYSTAVCSEGVNGTGTNQFGKNNEVKSLSLASFVDKNDSSGQNVLHVINVQAVGAMDYCVKDRTYQTQITDDYGIGGHQGVHFSCKDAYVANNVPNCEIIFTNWVFHDWNLHRSAHVVRLEALISQFTA